MLGVRRHQMPGFPTPILATSLKSVLAPKQVNQFLPHWWHWLAFLKLYMIHAKKIKNRSRKSQVMRWKRTAFFVGSLKKSEFPIPILTSGLQSVIAPKRIDRFWCARCQSLAFFKLYMIHFKKSKIGQEKTELWGVGCQLPPDAWFSHSNFDHLSTKCHSSQTNWLIFMQLVAFACIFEALYDSCQ